MVDLRAILYDGSYHEVDSDEMAFKIAASMGFKEAAHKASPVLLEPIMSVEVVVPEELMGVTIGDLNSRRGRIEGIEHRAGSQVIKSLVPLAEIFGYASDIRSITQGQAQYSIYFYRYEQAPPGTESGDDDAGVTANKPKGPKAGSGFAASELDAEFE
jgi:elongation factor G